MCLALGLLLLGACGASAPFDGLEPGETGRVVRIVDGDTLVLETGLTVRLVGIEAPDRGRRGAPGAPWAEESARALEDAALGRRVRLHYPGLTRDRYDRALAHAVTVDRLGPAVWLNGAQLEAGAAWMRLYPDTSGGASHLAAREVEARAAARGLWRLATYRPADAANVPDPGWRILKGKLDAPGIPVPGAADAGGAGERRDTDPLACSLSLDGGRVEIRVPGHAADACATPPGAPVEVRGYWRGSATLLAHALHLTAMPAAEDARSSSGK